MTRASSLAESGVFVVIEINRGPSGSPGPDRGTAGGCSSTPQPSDPPRALLGRLFGDSGYANAGATQSVLDVAARLIRTAARPPRDRPSWVHRSPALSLWLKRRSMRPRDLVSTAVAASCAGRIALNISDGAHGIGRSAARATVYRLPEPQTGSASFRGTGQESLNDEQPAVHQRCGSGARDHRKVGRRLEGRHDEARRPGHHHDPDDAPVDLNQAVDRYFQFVQRTVDVNRDLAISWAELVDTLTGATREQAESFSRIVRDQADTLAGMAAHQFEKNEQVAQGRAEQVEQERRVKRARQAEGDRVKQDRAKAREAYEGLTKAELSDQLAALGLPKSGNVDDLIDRLVEANDN